MALRVGSSKQSSLYRRLAEGLSALLHRRPRQAKPVTPRQTQRRLTPQQVEQLAAEYRAGTPSVDDTTPAYTSGSTGRGTVLAAGALAAVAGLGVVRARARRAEVRQPWPRRLWARRPWAPHPPSRAEVVAGQVLAVSARTREGARHLRRTAAPLAVAAAETARHRAVRAGEEVRHLGRTATPLVVAAAEAARHRAVLGAEEMRHLGAVASQAAVAALARARG